MDATITANIIGSLELAVEAMEAATRMDEPTSETTSRASPTGDPVHATVPDVLAIAHLWSTLESISTAVLARLVVEGEALATAPATTARHERELSGAFKGELALALRQSPAKTARFVTNSRELVHSMPSLFAALAGGALPAASAEAIAVESRKLSTSAQRRQLDSRLGEKIAYLHGAGVDEWRATAHAEVVDLEPERAREREEQARRERHVSIKALPDGMCRFSAVLPALEGYALHRRLEISAESHLGELAALNRELPPRDREVEPRTHAQLKADAFLDAMLGTSNLRDSRQEREFDPPLRVTLNVTVSDRALLSPRSQTLATIDGYAPVEAQPLLARLARAHLDQDIALFYRRLYTHPTSGELVAMESKRRVFPARMSDMIRLRDRTCRGPFCNALIRQTDHAVAWSRGGPTSLDNGQGLCVQCNAHKERFAEVTHEHLSVGAVDHSSEASSPVPSPAPSVPPPPSTSSTSADTSTSGEAPTSGELQAQPLARKRRRWTSTHGYTAVTGPPEALDNAA